MKFKLILLTISSLAGLLWLSCRKDASLPDKVIEVPTPAKPLTDTVDIVLALKPGENNPRNSEADFITLNDGTILMAYSHYTGSSNHDNAPAYIAARMSYDSGKTWTNKDNVIVPQEGKMNVMSISFLRLQNGKIAMFYVVKNTLQDCIPYVRISDNEGKTWSNSIACITDKKGYFVLNNNRVIQLKNGRILLPVSKQTDESLNWYDHEIGKLSTYYSDDNGITWKAGAYVPNYDNMLHQEPGVIELNDGKILMFFRTNQGKQYYSYSKDQGQTWSPVSPSSLRSPISPASITRIPSTKNLIAVWNNNVTEDPRYKNYRTPYNIATSSDEGKTWENTKVLANNIDEVYCYTAIHFVGDYVLLAHSAGNMSNGTGLSVLHITRVSLKWINKQ